MGRVRIIIENQERASTFMADEIRKALMNTIGISEDYEIFVVPDDEEWPELS